MSDYFSIILLVLIDVTWILWQQTLLADDITRKYSRENLLHLVLHAQSRKPLDFAGNPTEALRCTSLV